MECHDSEKVNKQKILIVHNYYQLPGGEDTVVANEKKLLEDNGHEVILYTRHNSEIKEMNLFQKMLLPFAAIFNIRTYADIRKIIRTENIDIVHVHNTLTLVSPSVYYAALRERRPVVQTVHNFRLLCPGAVFYRDGHICEDCVSGGLKCAVKHKCYRGSRMQTLLCVINTKIHRLTGIYGKLNYICLTEFNREKLLKLKQIKTDKVFVKPNFTFDESLSGQAAIVSETDRKNQVVFVGRLEKLKGIDKLLRVWKGLDNSAPRLIVCGTGPLEEWCEKYVSDNKINAEFKGFTANMEIKNILGESKAMILPAQSYEGFPMSILEAFSVGTPVICSNMGNCGYIVEEGVNGSKLSFDNADNADDVYAAIKQCRTLFESTYKTYIEKYSAEENYKRLMLIYNGVNR